MNTDRKFDVILNQVVKQLKQDKNYGIAKLEVNNTVDLIFDVNIDKNVHTIYVKFIKSAKNENWRMYITCKELGYNSKEIPNNSICFTNVRIEYMYNKNSDNDEKNSAVAILELDPKYHIMTS